MKIKKFEELDNKKINENDKTDLLQDMISIIYSFSVRLYRLRKKETRHN